MPNQIRNHIRMSLSRTLMQRAEIFIPHNQP